MQGERRRVYQGADLGERWASTSCSKAERTVTDLNSFLSRAHPRQNQMILLVLSLHPTHKDLCESMFLKVLFAIWKCRNNKYPPIKEQWNDETFMIDHSWMVFKSFWSILNDTIYLPLHDKGIIWYMIQTHPQHSEQTWQIHKNWNSNYVWYSN